MYLDGTPEFLAMEALLLRQPFYSGEAETFYQLR